MTILIVDDDDDIREVLGSLLAECGYDVEQARDGREAVTRIATGPLPRLVLLDAMMPVMSGEEVMQFLAREGYLSKIRVLQISASTAGRSLPGVHATLRKPCAVDVLLATVARQYGWADGP